jgi:hypothetical protein
VQIKLKQLAQARLLDHESCRNTSPAKSWDSSTVNAAEQSNPSSSLILRHRPHRIFFSGGSKILQTVDTDHNLVNPTNGHRGRIFANLKILISLVGQNAISEESYHHGYPSMCAKSKQIGCISLTLNIICFPLASFDYLIEKRLMHSVKR